MRVSRIPKGPWKCLKIMVSPVRIRVPPLLKVLQNAGKRKGPGSIAWGLCQQYVNSPSRKRFFQRSCGGVLHTVCGVGVDGQGHPDIGVPEHLLGG
jgi:hypothetical protein